MQIGLACVRVIIIIFNFHYGENLRVGLTYRTSYIYVHHSKSSVSPHLHLKHIVILTSRRRAQFVIHVWRRVTRCLGGLGEFAGWLKAPVGWDDGFGK